MGQSRRRPRTPCSPPPYGCQIGAKPPSWSRHVPVSPSTQHGFLFDALLAIAGDSALKLVADAAMSPTRPLQDEATRVLGDWPTRDAAPVLLSIADGAHPYRVRALRGYLRIVRQFDFSDAKRVEMVGKALPLADRDPERLLALAILEKHPSKSSLKLCSSSLTLVC